MPTSIKDSKVYSELGIANFTQKNTSKIFSIFAIMQKNKNQNSFLNLSASIFMVLALLLSSCTTKRGIKTVLNIPINVNKTFDSGKHINTHQETEFACIDYGFSLTDKQDLDKDLDSPGILTHFTYELPQTYNFIKADIFSYISPKFITEVPRYLLFKKLIIHQF